MSSALVVHGGTSDVPQVTRPEERAALSEATAVGLAIIERGGRADDAVTEAVAVLEDCGLFQAGRGATPQRDGVVRYDASLASSDGRAGSVQSVRRLRHPIRGARAVYERLRHTSLAGPVAEEVLEALGVELNPSAREPARPVGSCVRGYLREGGTVFTTVGAVARDARGLIAAATSTGGFVSALPGRVGDSGAVSVGTIATPRCGVSCTGDGDLMLLVGPATRVDALLDAGWGVERAVRRTFQLMEEVGALGGFIFLPPDGPPVIAQNVPTLRYAASDKAVTIQLRGKHAEP